MAQNDAWRAYVELALGLTDTSRKKAMKIVQQVAGKGGATAEQLQELVNQGMANREAMTRMIRVELDRALGRVGLATMDEVDELSRRVRELEAELRAARTAAPANGAEPVTASAATPASTRTAAKKTGANKTAAKKATAGKTAPARKAASAGKAAPARKAAPAGKAAPARKVASAGKAAPARKTAAAQKAAPARKTASAGKAAPARKTAAKTSPGGGASGAATGGADLAGGAS